MRLISCYIENFGGIKKKSYTFSEGLNKILGENGSGKTTLSVFLKVMLYGMSDTKKSGLEENDRKHYLPWDGSIASGSVEFSVGQKRYRAERSFYPKAADDSFSLYDLTTGKKSEDYSENLGKELFGIDCDGFERTVFLSERNLGEAGKNPTVSAKLGGLVGCDGDIEGLDGAIKTLEEERKRYNKRGGSGEIAEIKKRLAETEIRLSELDAIEARLHTERDRITENKAATKSAEDELKRLEKLKEDLIVKKAEGVGRERIAEIEGLIGEKSKELLPYESLFAGGVPDFDKIGEMSYKAAEGKRLAETKNDDPEYERLNRKFSSISESDISKAKEALKSEKNSSENRKSTAKSSILLWIGSLLLFAALGLGIFINAYFCLLSAVGILLIALYFVSAKSEKKKKKEKEDAIKAFLEKLPERSRESDSDEVRLAISEYEEYSSLSVFFKYKNAECERERERGKALLTEALAFLEVYKKSGEGAFEELRRAVHEYEKLTGEVRSLRSELKLLQSRMPSSDAGEPMINEAELTARRTQLEDSLRGLRRETANSERTVQSLSTALEEREDLFSLKEELSERLGACEEKYRIIMLTKELLAEAKDLMTSKYLGKTKAGFENYTNLISQENFADYEMDTSFSVSRLEGGKARTSEGYSKGTRDLYGIAARLALVDSLYEEESPPIILDDPFIALDDKKASRALKLLEKLGEKRQIIYFTCSESRK